MQQFISIDPRAFDKIEAIAFHEAAHILLAYYYGFRIGRFLTFPVEDFMSGRFKNAVNIQHEQDDPLDACATKAKQLLGGELSARIRLGMPTDKLVLAVNGAESIGPATPLNVVRSALRQNSSDASRVIDLVYQAQIQDWWNWIWQRHAEAGALLRQYKDQLEEIAGLVERALAKPDQWIGYPLWQKCLGTFLPQFQPPEWQQGTSIIGAEAIIKSARAAGVPNYNQDYMPQVYQTE